MAPNPGWKARWYAETHKIPHTRTMRMTSDEIKHLRRWLADNTTMQYHVMVRKTKLAKTHGIYSVVVYIADDELWPLFRLTWCYNG